MPKVGHATIFEYKSRITDLESEVSTLKRRLDELRRAKMQAFYKQPVIIRRCSKPDITADQPTPENLDLTGELTQKITRLQNELELAELKYTRDTGDLKDKIRTLQEELELVRNSHQLEVAALNEQHFLTVEMLKKSHTEELAMYEENLGRECQARIDAETELNEYKLQFRPNSLQMTDIEQLKKELSRLQGAYEELKLQHEQEVSALENRIAELLADVAASNEKSRRRFQLIPDRAYIVKTSSPTVSNSSIGSGSDKKSSSSLGSVKKGSPNQTTTRSMSCPENGRISKKQNSGFNDSATHSNTLNSSSATGSNHKLETIAQSSSSTPKNSPSPPPPRPKSCVSRKPGSQVSQPPEQRVSLCRPKSCWGDRKCGGGGGSFKRNTALGRQKFTKVTSKIDSGLSDQNTGGSLLPECGVKYKPVRKGSLGSPVPPWQIPSNSVAKSNRRQGSRSNG